MGTRKVKIQLYNKDRTKDQIVSNKFGDCILDDICIDCVVEENLGTSEYFLDAEFLVDNEGLYKSIEEEATLKVQTDYGTELFSIVDVRKTPSKIVVFGRQITISECIGSWLEDVRPEGKNGKDALVHMQGYSVGRKNLEFESDIDLENTAYYINQTLYDAIHISDNCFQVRWGGEIRRRNYKMIVNKKIGEETDVLIRSGKNLTGFEANTNIDSIVTRIKPVGFNGRTIDGYIDSPLINNYKYIKTQKMEYPHVKLREDLEGEPQESDLVFDTLGELQNKLTELALLEYLNQIDILRADYTVNFIDLSTTEEYKNYAKAETVQLGDYINVYEEKHDIKVTVRATSRKYNVMSQRVEEITLSNKTKDTKASNIETIKSRLDQVVEDVGYMNVTYAKIKDLESTNADIENLRATKAEITSLEAANADIGILNTSVATIQNLVNGNLSSENIQSLVLSTDKVTVDNGFIKNAMIDSLSADKINTGTLNTNNVSIQSEDGSMLINGTTQQFKDSNGVVRIQIGKDASGNFTFCLFSQDGVGVLIDEDGIKSGAIGDGLIVNDMVSDNASISGSKLDINSVIRSINDNGTETLKSSRIFLDEQNQSLQVAFNQLKTKVDTIEDITIEGDLANVIEQVTTNTTALNIQQGQIDSLISNTTITKSDGTVTQIKDEFNSVIDTVDSHTQTISNLQTNYDTLNNSVASANSKVSKLEQNLDGFKTTVSATYATQTSLNTTNSNVTTANNTANSALSKANTNANNITSLTTRMSSAEQKITSDAIVSTVTKSDSWSTQTNNITKAQNTASNAQSSASVNANNISNLATRVSNAEQKITSDAIVSTVTNSTSWKNQASDISDIKTRVSTAESKLTKSGLTTTIGNYYTTSTDVNNKLSSYATISKVSQTADSLTATFTDMHEAGYSQGITKIDKNGIKVTQSGYSGYTQMSSGGFYVNDGSKNVISCTSSGLTVEGEIHATDGTFEGTISGSEIVGSKFANESGSFEINYEGRMSIGNSSYTTVVEPYYGELQFYKSGKQTSAINCGAFEVYDDYGDILGALYRDSNKQGVALGAVSTSDSYLSLGYYNSSQPNSSVFTPSLIVSTSSSNRYYGYTLMDGINLIRPYCHDELRFTSSSGDTSPRLYNYSDGILRCIADGILFTIANYSGVWTAGMELSESTLDVYKDLDMNYNDILHAYVTSSLSATSMQTYSLRNRGTTDNKIYAPFTTTEGELRYVCREAVSTSEEFDYNENGEYVSTGRYVCYCEIPIFMAENMELNYHINICKNSFGDYRIIEKNPYFFILESKEDCFSFTYEVVGKQIETASTNNTVVANDGIIQEEK